MQDLTLEYFYQHVQFQTYFNGNKQLLLLTHFSQRHDEFFNIFPAVHTLLSSVLQRLTGVAALILILKINPSFLFIQSGEQQM